jgi:hypothetical protein
MLNRFKPWEEQNSMDFTRKNALVSARNTLTLGERLRHFMTDHRLSRRDLASIMRIAPRTLDSWLDGGVEPPDVVSAVLDLLEECSCGRRALGANVCQTGAPRGRLFQPGNTSRGTDPRREEMLRRVQAI